MIKNYFETKIPTGDIEAVVILVHGIGEHIGRYKHVFEFFNERNIAVAALDLRGHGKTVGRRGYSPDYETMLDDIDQFIREIQERFSNTSFFLYGHSMGGNLLANYVIKYSPKVSGVILSCPGLKLGYDAGRFKLLLAKLFWKIVPGLIVKNELDVNFLSRDSKVIDNFTKDKLTHNYISLRLAIETMKAGQWAVDNADKFKLPLLLMQALKDKIVDIDTNIKFSKLVGGQCELKEWPGQYHELHNEPEYPEILGYVVNWIEKTMNKRER